MCTSSTATPAATDGSVARGQEAEQRAQPLPAGRERLAGDLLRQPGPRGDGLRETGLDLGHVRRPGPASREPGSWRHAATPVCSATIEPPSRRKRDLAEARLASSSTSPSAVGKRLTDAGRYV